MTPPVPSLSRAKCPYYPTLRLIKVMNLMLLIPSLLNLPLLIQADSQNSIEDAFKISGTDKWYRHHYERHYAGWLNPLREKFKPSKQKS